MSRGRFELLYSVFNECSEELIVKSNFMFFFLYCVVFLFGFGCFFIIVFLSERQIYAFMFAVFVSGSGFASDAMRPIVRNSVGHVEYTSEHGVCQDGYGWP